MRAPAKSTKKKKAKSKPAKKRAKTTARNAPPLGKRREAQPRVEGHSLAHRIVTAPKLTDGKAARARIAEWLTTLSARDGRRLGALLSGHSSLSRVLASFAENSPYLWDLATGDPPRLIRLLDADPDRHLDHCFAETHRAVCASRDEDEVMQLLRRMKAEAALLIALADIGGVWPVMRAARALTDLADTAVDAAVRFILGEAAGAGQLKPADASQPHVGSGYIVLAMGKMGAYELNYSSDIDLIVLYDAEARALPKNAVPAPLFVKLTQRLVRLLQHRTADGYVFRTDLRLRPDPASTAIAISTAAAMSYYESAGQNWERAAMIKARACAGDMAAGQAVLAELSPFVWRRYLDFAAVADVHAMKRQINAFRGHGEIAVEGHNIKLGRGGIREIEFFAQTQQLIAGGRNPDLRDRDTLTTLDKLEREHWIDAAVRVDMKAAYCFLRMVEHRLQMLNDEQTQVLPAEREQLERFARFLGYGGRDAFARVFVGHLEKVQGHYVRLFEAAPGNGKPALTFRADANDRKTLSRLAELGFTKPLEASTIVRGWVDGSHRSLKGEASREHLQALIPMLIEHIGRSDNPHAALVQFDRFLANLHAPARLLSLLRQRPELIALTTLVLGTAPRLADTLARHPQVMDALVDPSFFGALPDEAELNRRLDAVLAHARGDEDLLDRIRMFGLEYMFLIGVRILSGTATAREAGEGYARLAGAIIRAVHAAVAGNFAAAYGHLRGAQTVVLAMGKVGGREMTAASDLDLMLIYDFDGKHPESDGKRALYGGQYFARLTQRLINALTAQTNYGALYDVDMRLRPSGRAGPLAVQLGGFTSYQQTEAWTWEHMALTRARIVSGSAAFGARIEKVIRDILTRPRDAVMIAGDVVEMRAAIAKEKGDSGRWDIKYVAGGLIDIEFIAQYLQLVHAHRLPQILDTSTTRVLDKARQLDLLSLEDAEVLRTAVRFYHDVTQILRLCLPGSFDPNKAGAGLLRLLARAADVPDFATLEATLIETQTKVRASFEKILGVAA
jgi:[glutamine synthetase] adenylyltransferase / [glutamine synthetase]-adenylyl-L-tyrosine phosphorylase